MVPYFVVFGRSIIFMILFFFQSGICNDVLVDIILSTAGINHRIRLLLSSPNIL